MNLFTEFELLIMISIISVLLLIIVILSISEILAKRREREIEEFNNLEETLEDLEITKKFMAFEEEDEVNLKNCEVVEEITSESSDFLLEDLGEVLDSEPLVVKVETSVFEDLNSKEKAQIELLKIEEELENPKSLEDTITNLETLEEESAIISYQELINNTRDLDIVLADDGDEPITISEVFKMFNEKNNEVNLEEAIDSISTNGTYSNFVSGGVESESLNEIQLENTANLEKLEKEIRKTNEFLNLLNHLKKNLE